MPKRVPRPIFNLNFISCLIKMCYIHTQNPFPAGFLACFGAKCNEFRQKIGNIIVYTLCKLQNIRKKRIILVPNRRMSAFLTELQLRSRFPSYDSRCDGICKAQPILVVPRHFRWMTRTTVRFGERDRPDHRGARLAPHSFPD